MKRVKVIRLWTGGCGAYFTHAYRYRGYDGALNLATHPLVGCDLMNFEAIGNRDHYLYLCKTHDNLEPILCKKFEDVLILWARINELLRKSSSGEKDCYNIRMEMSEDGNYYYTPGEDVGPLTTETIPGKLFIALLLDKPFGERKRDFVFNFLEPIKSKIKTPSCRQKIACWTIGINFVIQGFLEFSFIDESKAREFYNKLVEAERRCQEGQLATVEITIGNSGYSHSISSVW